MPCRGSYEHDLRIGITGVEHCRICGWVPGEGVFGQKPPARGKLGRDPKLGPAIPHPYGTNTVLLDGVSPGSRKAVELVEKHGDVCVFCRAELSDRTRTLEHVTPSSLGGGNSTANLRLSCSVCNNMRGNSPFKLFQLWRRRHPTQGSQQWWAYYRSLGFDLAEAD